VKRLRRPKGQAKLYKGRRANPHRLRDLADVQELIIHLNLPLELREQLDETVRAEYATNPFTRSGCAKHPLTPDSKRKSYHL
ncbi:MAG: hypothetical protein MN733_33455, partial [Nitrososphaera sp.]|nr:hypothetical protein [Nitrososphaera sp.]